jgi:L-idonate 5-dehydrogenase
MRAVIAYAAKDLRIEKVATPDVGLSEVRVRVGFGGICGSDLHYSTMAVLVPCAYANR